ncbi:MAG TPA: hypothetical protein ENH70_07145, partial [Desulfobacteraceae bacterium]|nr:hypothetical protein [Desulfobacteraceae bacterium]
ALEVNIECSRVDVTVDQRYKVLEQVMGKYYGVREGLQTFLEEICHPYRNWEFIVKEARTYALNYFHVLKTHPEGPEAARLYMDIFFQAIDSLEDGDVRTNAADNLLLYIQKVIKEAGPDLLRFLPILDYAFDRIRCYPKDTAFLFVKSFYQFNRLGELYLQTVPSGSGFSAINRFLIHLYRYTYDYWLQQLDLFLGRILKTLFHQSHELPKESLRLLLSYDPQKAITPIHPVKKGLPDIIHLGNKGLNLTRIKNYGLPVPPGFIITTEVFRCREIVDHYLPAKKNLDQQVALELVGLERLTGKKFGDPENPLLLSVRSGSSISQPGMMDTFLDVGIDETIVLGLVAQTGNEWFGWDTYRRFLQSYGMAFGLSRDDFDAIIDDFKQRLGVPYKKDFTGQQMRDITLTYKSLIQENGIESESSHFGQLNVAIQKVFDSWHTKKAETYRRIMGISDDWGTAVTVQAMVFGNFSRESGAGVFFTHNPRWSGDMLMLWGDFTPGNQGEDVVSGLVKTHAISKRQAEIENRQSEMTLEARFPDVYQTMRKWAKDLVYERRWSPQEMEFTFEGPGTEDLFCLQTRDMVMRERKKVYSFDTVQEKPVRFLGHGIGVSGGAMTGRVVFSLEEIKHWRKAEPGTSLIIVRSDTVPDDIREIHEADGLLTARGGSTSHAAIVAHRLGKTCVVGCADLICMEKQRACSLNQKHLKSGDWVSIDGLEGSVYSGQMKIREMERD